MILPVKVNEFVNNIFTHLRQTNLFWTFRLKTDNFPHNPLRQSSQCWTQDFNSSPPSAAYMRLWIRSALVQIMACHLFGAKPLSKPGSAGLLWIEPIGTNFSEILIKIQNFSFIKMHMKVLAAKWLPFFPGGDVLSTQCAPLFLCESYGKISGFSDIKRICVSFI